MSFTMAIADDNASFASAIEKKFALSKNFKVLGTTSNGKEMLELVKMKRPDLLLIDIVMPVMDGIDLLKEIRNIDKIIVSSADKFSNRYGSIVSAFYSNSINKLFDSSDFTLF